MRQTDGQTDQTEALRLPLWTLGTVDIFGQTFSMPESPEHNLSPNLINPY